RSSIRCPFRIPPPDRPRVLGSHSATPRTRRRIQYAHETTPASYVENTENQVAHTSPSITVRLRSETNARGLFGPSLRSSTQGMGISMNDTAFAARIADDAGRL